MFGHLTGNDPRPHYFHQTNIAQSDPNAPATATNVGGTLYAVIDTLLARYDQIFDRASAPLVQVSQQQVADLLLQQDTWAAARRSGAVSAWLQDGHIHIANTGAAVDVPVTGATEGGLYGGQKSGWISLGAGAKLVLEPNDPAPATPPAISGTAKVGQKLTATSGTWTGTEPIVSRFRWQRCDAKGLSCASIPGATGETYEVASADAGSRLRVAAFAGNWISSVAQAVSPVVTGVVPKPPGAVRGSQGPNDRKGSGNNNGKPTRLALKRVRISPRRFAVAHRRKRLGTRLDGATITWRLNKAAKVRLKFQKVRGARKHRHWVKVGTIKRSAKAGKSIVRFRGRFGQRLLSPGRYRVNVTATRKGQRSGPKRVRFRVVKG